MFSCAWPRAPEEVGQAAMLSSLQHLPVHRLLAFWAMTFHVHGNQTKKITCKKRARANQSDNNNNNHASVTSHELHRKPAHLFTEGYKQVVCLLTISYLHISQARACSRLQTDTTCVQQLARNLRKSNRSIKVAWNRQAFTYMPELMRAVLHAFQTTSCALPRQPSDPQPKSARARFPSEINSVQKSVTSGSVLGGARISRVTGARDFPPSLWFQLWSWRKVGLTVLTAHAVQVAHYFWCVI